MADQPKYHRGGSLRRSLRHSGASSTNDLHSAEAAATAAANTTKKRTKSCNQGDLRHISNTESADTAQLDGSHKNTRVKACSAAKKPKLANSAHLKQDINPVTPAAINPSRRVTRRSSQELADIQQVAQRVTRRSSQELSELKDTVQRTTRRSSQELTNNISQRVTRRSSQDCADHKDPKKLNSARQEIIQPIQPAKAKTSPKSRKRKISTASCSSGGSSGLSAQLLDSTPAQQRRHPARKRKISAPSSTVFQDILTGIRRALRSNSEASLVEGLPYYSPRRPRSKSVPGRLPGSINPSPIEGQAASGVKRQSPSPDQPTGGSGNKPKKKKVPTATLR